MERVNFPRQTSLPRHVPGLVQIPKLHSSAWEVEEFGAAVSKCSRCPEDDVRNSVLIPSLPDTDVLPSAALLFACVWPQAFSQSRHWASCFGKLPGSCNQWLCLGEYQRWAENGSPSHLQGPPVVTPFTNSLFGGRGPLLK